MIPRGALLVLAAFLGSPSSNGAAATTAATPGVGRAPAATAPSASTPAPDAATPGLFESALRDDTDLLVLPSARRPPPLPTVIAATRTTARPDAFAAVVLDPKMIRQALPSLVRADVVATRPGPRADAWPDRLIAWEVEIPLFNLKGKGWLQQRGATVEIDLVEGAFAPGRLRFRFASSVPTGSPTVSPRILPAIAPTIVTCELQVDFRASNFVLRRVARHDPWAESAMSAAIAWVALRALTLRAEAPRAGPPLRPQAGMQPPAADALDGSLLAGPTLASLRAAGTLAAVRRAPSGRLAWASVAIEVPLPPTTVATRVAAPETWRVFPGWGSVIRRAESKPPVAPSAVAIEVVDNVAFVDLDAVWLVGVTTGGRATAVEGAIRGAVMRWDVAPGDRPGSSLTMLSMHPRLDQAGFLERRLIEAEPLLEHAFAAALTYVDVAAVADSLAEPARNR